MWKEIKTQRPERHAPRLVTRHSGRAHGEKARSKEKLQEFQDRWERSGLKFPKFQNIQQCKSVLTQMRVKSQNSNEGKNARNLKDYSKTDDLKRKMNREELKMWFLKANESEMTVECCQDAARK